MTRSLKVKTAATLALALAACAPEIPEEDNRGTAGVMARFDPSASPPVVPTPTDLAVGQEGRLSIPTPDGAAQVDAEFYAYLNQLSGYPTTSGATATFTGALQAASVTAESVRVLDVNDGLKPVSGVTIAYGAPASGQSISRIAIAPPATGWLAGHRYAVAVVGGEAGVKAEDGSQVAATPSFLFVRSPTPLVTCPEDLASSNCAPTVSVIPSSSPELEVRSKAQLESAIKLERIRQGYDPVLKKLETEGVKRQDVVLVWTFKATDDAAAVFDPGAATPRVPSPNDLALNPATGMVDIKLSSADAPAAEKEFVEYLNSQDGFSALSTATTAVSVDEQDPLDAKTVNTDTVKVLDLTTGKPATARVTYAGGAIRVDPASCHWTPGHRYAVAVLGGSDAGVKTTKGKWLVPTTAWALARSSASLVTCAELTDASCQVAITAAPISLTQARGLEQLRRTYKPALDALAAAGTPRSSVSLLWTFKVTSSTELIFNPAASVIPFPNNAVLTGTGANTKVTLPVPAVKGMQQDLVLGLNTLDGFSTTAAVVSENGDACGAATRPLDEATLAEGAVGLRNVTQKANAVAPDFTPCMGCASAVTGVGGETGPQELQLRLNRPLEERNTYAAYISSAVRDVDGNPVIASPSFVLARASGPLFANGKSTVPQLADAQAQQLEPLRAGLSPLVAMLEANGIPRTSQALVWAFTTQSTITPLRQLAKVPYDPNLGLPTDVTVQDMSAMLPALDAKGIPVDKIGKLYMGTLTTANLLVGTQGTFDPTKAPRLESISFVLTIPTGEAPPTGWPVTVFGHGLTRGRTDMFAIANTLATSSPFTTAKATIAIDTVFHGDRSDCRRAGSLFATASNPAPSDNMACADGATCKQDTGRCEAANGALAFRMGDDGFTPVISGWNIINPLNLFATRDNFRQQVVDLSQVVRVVQQDTGTGSLAAQTEALDGNSITYVGQSLGGILGTLFLAANHDPGVQTAVLNVPGGDPIDIQLTAPSFASRVEALNQLLGSAGMPRGSGGYENFLRIAKWVMDPADPQNMSFYMLNQAPTGTPAGRKVLVQYIEGDQTVPNPTTEKLIRAANEHPDSAATVDLSFFNAPANRPECGRHGFLLAPKSTSSRCSYEDPDTTEAGQFEVATYLTTGALLP